MPNKNNSSGQTMAPIPQPKTYRLHKRCNGRVICIYDTTSSDGAVTEDETSSLKEKSVSNRSSTFILPSGLQSTRVQQQQQQQLVEQISQSAYTQNLSNRVDTNKSEDYITQILNRLDEVKAILTKQLATAHCQSCRNRSMESHISSEIFVERSPASVSASSTQPQQQQQQQFTEASPECKAWLKQKKIERVIATSVEDRTTESGADDDSKNPSPVAGQEGSISGDTASSVLLSNPSRRHRHSVSPSSCSTYASDDNSRDRPSSNKQLSIPVAAASKVSVFKNPGQIVRDRMLIVMPQRTAVKQTEQHNQQTGFTLLDNKHKHALAPKDVGISNNENNCTESKPISRATVQKLIKILQQTLNSEQN